MGTPKLTEEEVDQRLLKRNIRRIGSYVNIDTSVQVSCLVCGEKWRGWPNNMFRGHGCPECWRLRRGSTSRLTMDELQKYLSRLKTRGITMLCEYVRMEDKGLFRCRCGHEWSAQIQNIFRGRGCPKCAQRDRVTAKTLSEADLQPRYNELAQRGITLVGDYIKARIRIRFRHTCGHEWSAAPCDIFDGTGCPKCADYGFQSDKPAVLYYVRVRTAFGYFVYKIGVTNRTVRERFRNEFCKVTSIKTWHFQNGSEAHETEQDILKDHDADRYEGPDVLTMGGNDELFNCDVLQLDNGDGQLELVA